jgi:hypothetical protein
MAPVFVTLAEVDGLPLDVQRGAMRSPTATGEVAEVVSPRDVVAGVVDVGVCVVVTIASTTGGLTLTEAGN